MKVYVRKVILKIFAQKIGEICFLVEYKRFWWQNWKFLKDKYNNPIVFYSISEMQDKLKARGLTEI